MTIYYPPTQNGLQKELDAQLDEGTTAALTLNNVTGVQNKPGVILINRIDSGGTEKSASLREWVAFTGTSGNTLTGLTRALGGSTDQDHAVGSVVEFVFDAVQYDELLDTLFDSSGNLIAPASADFIDALTEIDASLKSGDDATLVTGTAGTTDYTSKWNADGDLVDGYEVLDEDDMTSDSATKLATQQSIKAYVDSSGGGSTDGWLEAGETWTYASASSFTIASTDVTTKYQKGTKIKFTQSTGGTKYFYVASSSFSTNTTVNIIPHDGATIANEAISSPNYSYQTSPQGFPTSFAFSPTYAGFSSAPTGDLKYHVVGNVFYGQINSGVGTSDATTTTFTVPVTPQNEDDAVVVFTCHAYDNGAHQDASGALGILDNNATLRVGKTQSTVNGNGFAGWTGSGNKAFYANFWFSF